MNTSRGEEAPAPDGQACSLPEALLDALDTAVIACDADGRLSYANAGARALWDRRGSLGGDATDIFMLTDEHGELPAAGHPLARALAGEQTPAERLHVLTPAGGEIPVDVSARPVADRGAVMTAARYRESAGEARLRTYVSDFEILTEVSRLLADVQDADEAASIICTVAIGSTGAIAVLLWEVEREHLVLRWQEGIVDAGALDELTTAAREGAQRAVVERCKQVLHPDAHARPAAEAAIAAGTAWHEPLMAGGRATGALSIVWPGVLTDLERPGWLIEALAHHAAVALERADLVRRLNAAARTDPLTGLANRRVWSERLEHELARADREESPLSLVLIDIDKFKSYNDRFGHPEGDALLQEAAEAWTAQVRTTDLLSRVGGEEFAVLLPACPQEDAVIVAERLRVTMPRGETCSLGVATWDGEATPSQLYAIADAALYRAKEGGRNQVQIGESAGGRSVVV